MSTLLESVFDFEAAATPIDKEFKLKLFNNNRSLKSKENKFKLKLNRELRKKLKKYKLRRDGQEDPEVLDVSQILVSALKIKSPNNKETINDINDTEEELRPKNYLFKMGRKKMILKKKVEANNGNTLVTNDGVQKEERDKAILSPGMTVDKEIHISNTPNVTCDNSDDTDKIFHNNCTNNDSSKKSKDTKHTNAFTLMMDSRNKSIGSNSPGKEKVIDEFESQSLIEKKNMKAKRNILLQKMAEAKGSLKNKEMEEYQEECIKKKMEKRAERLKSLINGTDSKPVIKSNVKTPSNKEGDTEIVSVKDNEKHVSTPKNKLQLVNIFNDSAKVQNIHNNKKEIVTKEDVEFLSKLSPSLKKKENMLSYFKKVEKEHDDNILCVDDDVDDNNHVIKVKLKSKVKNKIKKKKLSLTKNRDHDENCDLNKEGNIIEEPKKDRQGKSLKYDEKVSLSKNNDSAVPSELDIMRPRRNVKRPAKYIDDMKLSSSDEELHIFTPKKKKHLDRQNKCISDQQEDIDVVEDMPKKNLKHTESKPKVTNSKKTHNNKKLEKEIQPKKYTKLAPIFATKPQLDAAAIEAKQKFLNSGVPEKLKKVIEKQTIKSLGTNNFHKVVHVQQNETFVSPILFEFETISQTSDEVADEIVCERDFFKKILKLDEMKEDTNSIIAKSKPKAILQNIKQLYPKFPVYRTYRLLREKNRGESKDCSYLDLDNSIEVFNSMIDMNNESPDRLSWTDKYKAMSSKQIIGNYESIKELKKWLITWTENDSKPKKNNNANSDSSDFYLSDTDSKDSMKSTNNLLVITGPVGSGKTAIVYAVAAELAIKVLEVNASNKRTGKIMLQDLQEATQSHKVNRGKSSQEMSQKSQDIIQAEKPKVKKRGRPKKGEALKTKLEPLPKNETLSQPSGSQDSVRTCMSLILIDDADIVFDQDDGFCAAIVQLVHCSKRPVILITSSTSCPHLQRFLQCAKMIHTHPLSPRMLGTWLDIMCLADTGTCSPGLGAKFLDYFKGDIRKTINFLQFQTAKDSVAESDGTSQNIDDYKVNIEDENSNMSWSDREGLEEVNEKIDTDGTANSKIWHCLMKENASLLSYKNVFQVWWNIPRLLIENHGLCIGGENSRVACKTHLNVVSNVAEMISIADYYCYSPDNLDTELISVPWINYESHSVSENESLDKYEKSYEVKNEISHYLMSGSIMDAQRSLELKSSTDLHFPEMATRREKRRIVDRHNKLSSFLSPSAVLDRRALALDYWSGCRTICRVEKTKTDSNSKRNNRFCHYLKSANILCKSDSFDNLANSLYCEQEF